MQISNDKQDLRSDGPVWVLLAELLFSDFLSDHARKDGLMAGLMFQTIQEFGMSPECIENITRTLAGFAQEALAHQEQERLEFPRWIRIFCQKKMIVDANAASASGSDPIEQGKKQEQIFPDCEASQIGGWGYFLIERGEDLPPYSSGIPHTSIDLYLYKEGE
jgi:hypothetical protein